MDSRRRAPDAPALVPAPDSGRAGLGWTGRLAGVADAEDGAEVMLTVLSLGAGVQSSTLALMAAEGELPMPECAIFSDTRAEPAPVYRWLEWLEPRLPFPVYRVQKWQGLRANVVQVVPSGREVWIPAFTQSANGTGQLRRQCTPFFKIRPIERRLRQLLGIDGRRTPKGVLVKLWLGISLDEWQRMRSSRQPWIENQWPLIDKRMTRADCLTWLTRHGYPTPPKSSCTFCPYRSATGWRWLKDNDPVGWQDAVEVDRLIRDGAHGRPERLYLHRSLRPLEEVDLSTPEERGQLPLWAEGCEGGYCWS